MVLDLGLFERALADAHNGLDHRFLDEINDLGPATLENLSAWIWRKLLLPTTGRRQPSQECQHIADCSLAPAGRQASPP